MKPWFVASTLIALSGCTSLTTSPTDPAPKPVMDTVRAAQPVLSGDPLTLKQIMADPAWIGYAPVGARWGDDGRSVVYAQKREGTPLYDLYRQPLAGEAVKVALSEQHLVAQEEAVYSQDRRFKAYVFEGNLFVKDLSDHQVRQLTRDNTAQSQPMFLADGRLSYRQDDSLYALSLDSGLTQLLAELQLAEAPKEVGEPQSFLAAQQHRLIKYVALQDHNRKLRKAEERQLAADNATLAAKPFYLGEKNSIVEVSLSPDGRYLVVATQPKDYSWRAKHDIMPNYLGAKGYVDAVPARARVAEDKPPAQQLWLLDLTNGKQQQLSYETLPGFDEDVLAKVRQANHAEQGKTYESKKSPRKIRLMQDWGWDQSAVAWRRDGSQVAIMLEAIDNKDRWLATLDFDKGELVPQHRLHDDAWVNYTHNEFGWLNNQETLYYLSEESGYSQLYLKPLAGETRALTRGQYVVSSLTLTTDDRHIYYKANKKHPGKYEIYRVNLADGVSEALTDLNGMTDYWLSPDEQQLLLSHSSLLRHADLYVKPARSGGEVRRLTDTVSEEFASYDWQAPQIVAVPSSHTQAPVYAKIYLPAGYDASKAKQYPAVIFNHGAGYLQNSHYGWSGYFREFMFHNLLAQQGYVVMDMDYRASKGYGRDWRTAIYRQMGRPEVEDLQDGVNYLVDQVHVDRGRVGTYGGSYGGFLTFMALFTEPDLFQAGAALRPVTDWAHYNYGYTSNILNTPDDDPMAYAVSSPIEHAEGLTKPLLIMAGVLDDNVFFQDSVRLVQRLIELEKPMFETAIYPVEPHGFRQPSSWLDEYSRIYKLFEKELK